ncbi:MAG: ribose 5-phosphate isomerase B [Lachnospiraceae bacterium]|nr:ribose 5-phosphate isomerase B [Lachnospiraceae bacterium]
MKIAIGNDHAAIELKKTIKEYLESLGNEVVDLGANENKGISYTVFGEAVAEKVVAKEVDFGVLICGTGVGISIAANKVPGIRAAVCSDPTTARLVKEHNNANIIAFGARIVGSEAAKDIVDAYMNATFQGGRHADRVNMISDIEKKYSK